MKQENIRNQLSKVRKVMHGKYITSIANIDDVNIPAQIIKNQNGIWPSKTTLVSDSIISDVIENKMNIRVKTVKSDLSRAQKQQTCYYYYLACRC